MIEGLIRILIISGDARGLVLTTCCSNIFLVVGPNTLLSFLLRSSSQLLYFLGRDKAYEAWLMPASYTSRRCFSPWRMSQNVGSLRALSGILTETQASSAVMRLTQKHKAPRRNRRPRCCDPGDKLWGSTNEAL